jgi:peptide deformylase
MVLPVITFPNKVLRQKTELVTFPLSKEIKKLTKDMFETVKETDGIGLAAPQVGKSVKLVVINLEKNGIPPFALYNPRIKSKRFKKVEIEEGCLSLPGIYGNVKRPRQVTIEAQNGRGEKVLITDDGWISRVAQHEIDHINGVLIIDLIKKYSQGEDIVKAWKQQKLL